MEVKVELHGELRGAIGHEVMVTLPQGATVNQLLARIAERVGETFKRKMVDSSGELLPQLLLKVLVNGTHSEFERKLVEGDVISLFPLSSIGGG